MGLLSFLHNLLWLEKFCSVERIMKEKQFIIGRDVLMANNITHIQVLRVKISTDKTIPFDIQCDF